MRSRPIRPGVFDGTSRLMRLRELEALERTATSSSRNVVSGEERLAERVVYGVPMPGLSLAGFSHHHRLILEAG